MPRRSTVAEAAGPSLAQRAGLGPKSALWLAEAGISTWEQLQALGAVAAYVQVRQAGRPASLNLLWALEGALSGLHWQVVAREHRTSLLLALEDALHALSGRPGAS
ncbi:TfoX/Sxy family protein [Ideonella livida]|uniref:TfoX/Sxy family protein n=1 Tax=Ideonella livida TaxID=2707176 RepID=A0A7C9TK61_9BURK|nr:TfoX/Sxy family protein [Ideonella livida]NDY92579.1 TfoX/Sxy family protein [Ideonella livida]